VWATAVALAVLETRLARLSAEWGVMAGKARKWMRRNVDAVSWGGAVSVAADAAADAKVEALVAHARTVVQ
jgi:hypothetical protein